MVQFDKEASQARDYTVAGEPRDASRGSPSPSRAQKKLARDDNQAVPLPDFSFDFNQIATRSEWHLLSSTR